jgi:hypothetical protein
MPGNLNQNPDSDRKEKPHMQQKRRIKTDK